MLGPVRIVFDSSLKCIVTTDDWSIHYIGFKATKQLSATPQSPTADNLEVLQCAPKSRRVWAMLTCTILLTSSVGNRTCYLEHGRSTRYKLSRQVIIDALSTPLILSQIHGYLPIPLHQIGGLIWGQVTDVAIIMNAKAMCETSTCWKRISHQRL